MENFLKRYWVTLLGMAFLLGSFFTFFEMALQNGWLPPQARIALGLVAGASIGYVAFHFYKKQKQVLSESIAGLGSGVFFVTIAYASFSEHIMWSPNVLLLSMVALVALIMFIGFKFKMRILSIISVLTGLCTPLIIRATPDQVNGLFIYVLLINVLALVLSVVRKWDELRIISFFSTALIFITYYFYFDPESWGRPFFYVTALFGVYMVGLFATSKINNNQYSGINFYLGVINAIHYVFWSLFILSSFNIAHALPTLIVAISFVGGGVFIYQNNSKDVIPALAYFLMGVFVLAISGENFSQLFSSKGMPYVINSSIWLSIALLIYGVGKRVKQLHVQLIGMAVWLLVIVYWYSVAWNVEWLPWFGVTFIPFINPGALLWIAFAASGFLLSRDVERGETIEQLKDHQKTFSVALAIVAHLVVGGLLTIQIDNLWEAYTISGIKSGIVISTAWFLYALGLFVWGKFTKTKAFMWLGGMVLVVSSLRMWIIDLPGESNVYKVLFLSLSGGVILLIGYVHRKWLDEDKTIAEKEQTEDLSKTLSE